MPIKPLKLVVLLFVGILTSSSLAQKSDSSLFADDPIASMLDSLARLPFFNNEFTTPASEKGGRKHNYPFDSVPRFDEITFESRLAKLDVNSPFSLQYNDAVKGYIEMYANRKRELVARMIGISQLYFPMFEEMLDRYKLPLEFKYLAIVESALNPNVRSRSGAMGLWQFMYSTGKMFGLKINSYVDERCDPYKSTVAACEYLQYLYEMFNDWEMVLAAYNSGPGTVNKAIRRSGGRKTYWEIRPYLPRETQGYVPAFIAVNYVMNYTAEHNLHCSVPIRSFFQLDTVSIKQQLSFEQISATLDIPVEEIRFLNPQYKRNVIPFNGIDNYVLSLPSTKIGAFINNEAAIYNYLKKDSSYYAMKEVKKWITVKRGEHLQTIANKYRCSVNDIKEWNKLRSFSVKPGQKLAVYMLVPQNSPEAIASKSNKPIAPAVSTAVNANAQGKMYTIQKGDTLWTIAKKNGISIEELKRLNNLGAKYMLLPGQKLKVS